MEKLKKILYWILTFVLGIIIFLLLGASVSAIIKKDFSGALITTGFAIIPGLILIPVQKLKPKEKKIKIKNKLSLIALLLGIIAVSVMYATVQNILIDAEKTKSNASTLSSEINSSFSNVDEVMKKYEAEGYALGTQIGASIVMPSIICCGVGVLLNAIGYRKNNKTITLISAILYLLSLILMPTYGFASIPSMILQFIAYSKMKQQELKKEKEI